MNYRFLVTIILSTFSTVASACPTFTDLALVDYNCDRQIKVVVVGDSIVSGSGDSSRRPHGYPARFKKIMKETLELQVKAVGFPGITSGRLLSTYTAAYARNKTTPKRIDRTVSNLLWADLIVVDVGRNDYWSKISPSITANNIKRLVALLKKHNRNNGVPTMVVTATLLPTLRGFQAPFIDSVNRYLLAQSSNKFPVLFRFDKMPKRHLLGDGLHPSSGGYQWMAEYFERVYLDEIQIRMNNYHTDFDDDGVYDLLERRHFGTDDLTADTDGDTYSDGQELFEYYTDPLDINDFPLLPPDTETETEEPVVPDSET